MKIYFLHSLIIKPMLQNMMTSKMKEMKNKGQFENN